MTKLVVLCEWVDGNMMLMVKFFIFRTNRPNFTEAWIGFSFLHRKNFRMHYKNILLLLE